MSAATRVPMSVVRGRSQFPEGLYKGTIAESQDGQKDDGSAGSVNFQLQNNEVIEGEGNPGARPHFVRLTTWVAQTDARGKETSLMVADIDPSDEEVPYNLRSSYASLTALAIQLGAANIEGTDAVFVDSIEAFIESLTAGEYDGQEVEFKVSHTISKKERETAKAESRAPRAFVNTEFTIPVEGAEQPEPTDGVETQAEEVEEVAEEVETPAPKATSGKNLVRGAQARQATSKPSGAAKTAPVGSGKPKFVRKGGKR